MMYLRRGIINSAAVRRLEEILDGLGYPIARISGTFGNELDGIVREFQRTHGLDPDGIVGPLTWAALEADVTREAHLPEPEPWMVDIRGTHPPPRLHAEEWFTAPAMRPDGVVLHQTSVRLSSNPERWKTLNAHLGIMSDGRVVLVNNPSMPIWHAQGLSACIGIEVSGNYYGVDGHDGTLFKPGGGPDHLSDAMRARERDLYDWLQRWFDAAGAKWQHVYAHRQATDSRRGDPGEEIWRWFGAPWCERLRRTGIDYPCGLPGWRVGSGRPIPKEWGGHPADRY